VRHREVELARLVSPRPVGHATGEPHSRLGPAGDLDVEPGEGSRHAEPERLADRLLAGEASGVVLRRIRPRVAVVTLGLGEDSLAEGRIALERAPDPADLDEVEADLHEPSR
jgi:hypothetical protein